MIYVHCLEDGRSYGFSAKTSYEAMQGMQYALNLSHKDPTAVINKTESGSHLWMEHCGKTYSVRS